jgi:hypothetical protein
MITRQVCATLIFSLLLEVPAFGQRPSPEEVAARRRAGIVAQQDNQIAAEKRIYDSSLARGYEKGAAIAAGQLGLLYEQREDYANAGIWWRNNYEKGGGPEGLNKFINLVLLNRITVDDPDKIRPLIEVRAFCGSQMARAYLLNHWQETPAQLPDYDYANKSIAACGPAGPEDRMDQSLMLAARRRQYDQANAEFYRKHPEQDPKFKAQQAAEGAAIFLGALAVIAASLPASGPGSVACNKYRNGYPGANDPSVCNVPPSK